MTDAELMELVQKIILGRPDARDPLFALLKALSDGDVTGAQVAITGYTIGTAGALDATDTVNEALGKLEARVVELETA